MNGNGRAVGARVILRVANFEFALLALFACSSAPKIPEEVFRTVPAKALVASTHSGPEVVEASSGPARFAKALFEHFDTERAMTTVRFVDGFHREPGNDGFEASLDHVKARLQAAGFGSAEGLLLEEIQSDLGAPAWTPVSGRLELSTGTEVRVLHAFDTPGGADRTLLPVGAPSGRASGRPVFSMDQLTGGEVLVVDATAAGAGRPDPVAAQRSGASALLVYSLADYNVDPSGRERHLDAIQYRSVRRNSPIPTMQISRRSFLAIQAAAQADTSAILKLEAVVREDERKLRTLVATVVGVDRPEECVVTVAHVQEPGAVDNASGVGGICELACTVAELLRKEPKAAIDRPSRSVVFIFGDEMRESRIWLDAKRRVTVAAISADMIGASHEMTGATALLERTPDPGAVKLLEPDRHTAWGSAEVSYAELRPSGINAVARMALADIGALAGNWPTSEHPYEGGSDHDVFLKAGIPALLFWHFTDFAYHTSLDRLDHVDPQELRRMSCAVGAATLALADPRPGDLDRYLRTNLAEKRLREGAAKKAGDALLAAQWGAWCESVRHWFRRECLRLEPQEVPPKKG